MDDHIELALIECLDALEQGESVEQVLARYPELASELAPMLETAVALPQLNVQPSLAAQRRSRDAFLSQAAAQKKAKTARPSPWLNLRRLLAPVAALALVMIIFAAGIGPLSADALPGDAFYGTKILLENARSAFTTNPAADAALTEQFNQRRIQEIKALLSQSRTADVAFTGEIEAVQPDVWIISGLRTEIDSVTQIVGSGPVTGQMAEVNGRTDNGRLIATTITLLPTNIPLPTPTPTTTTAATETPIQPLEDQTATLTPSPTNTATPTATETATPTPTMTATATETPSPSPTIELEPTETPQPPPATPVPNNNDDDGGNDNGDDNSNDNDDDDDNSGDNDNDNDSNDNDNDNDDNRNDNDDDDDNDNS